MTIPQPYLPPPSQPWGRWVVSNIQRLSRVFDKLQRDVNNSLRQLNIAQRQPMRAVLWSQTGGTVTIDTAGEYVPINIAGTLEDDIVFNMAASSSPNVSGLTNTTNQSRLVFVLGTIDARGAFSQTMGLRFSLNGVGVDATVCEAHNGFNDRTAKLVTHFIFRLDPGDVVALECTNVDNTRDVNIDRYRLTAYAIQ